MTTHARDNGGRASSPATTSTADPANRASTPALDGELSSRPSTPPQRATLVASILEVAAGAADPWETAHLVGLVVRIVPARRARKRLVESVVFVPCVGEEARGRLVLEGVALAALRAAGLDEDSTTVAAIAGDVATAIGWPTSIRRAA